jgi:hypothetical protein
MRRAPARVFSLARALLSSSHRGGTIASTAACATTAACSCTAGNSHHHQQRQQQQQPRGCNQVLSLLQMQRMQHTRAAPAASHTPLDPAVARQLVAAVGGASKASSAAAVCAQHGVDEGYQEPMPPELVLYPQNTQQVGCGVCLCVCGRVEVVAGPGVGLACMRQLAPCSSAAHLDSASALRTGVRRAGAVQRARRPCHPLWRGHVHRGARVRRQRRRVPRLAGHEQRPARGARGHVCRGAGASPHVCRMCCVRVWACVCGHASAGQLSCLPDCSGTPRPSHAHTHTCWHATRAVRCSCCGAPASAYVPAAGCHAQAAERAPARQRAVLLSGPWRGCHAGRHGQHARLRHQHGARGLWCAAACAWVPGVSGLQPGAPDVGRAWCPAEW